LLQSPAGGPTDGTSLIAGAENVYSNGSDLYAEIGTGPNSARSSTYAQVGSLSRFGGLGVSRDDGGRSGGTRPVLPSVDALQQLVHSVAIDPGR